MSLHTGSRQMAHQLNRFSYQAEFEDVAGEAARLNVDIDILRIYLDWYGRELVTTISRRGKVQMPAYEAELRWQVLGEKLECID